ncbi:MAG: hypothetical protein LBE81_01700 [Azonexus sp.]|jgi:hypothetical protein|uniref:hypothetical protein n=1 Tax=Azonexus sp. TaxID=1872668 RepID=UPI002831AF1B|nr:hypothetical protein [Azonexus sp.]MDR0775340.1 hypothetical protein [Azonexus sp.]
MTAIRCLLACCFLWVALPVWAGMEPEGYSLKEGVFYALPSDFAREGQDPEIRAIIQFDSPEKVVALRDHCERGGFVFPHQSQARYKCKVHLLDYDDMASYGLIEIVGATIDKYDLFTTRPARRSQWEVRPLSADELAGIAALIQASPERYGNLGKYVVSGKAFAVHKAEGKLTAYFIPGRWVRDEYYEAQRHHVFVGSEGSYRYQGQLVDKPERYYDLDGDGLPEVETSESCDGRCVKLWDISRAPKEIARWGGH